MEKKLISSPKSIDYRVIWVKDRIAGAQFSEKKLYGKDPQTS